MVPSGKEWSNEEIELLLELTHNKPLNSIVWSEVANCFQTRTSTELRNKYMYVMPGVIKGKWTAEEDLRIEIAYRVFGPNWTKIASVFGNETNTNTRTMI